MGKFLCHTVQRLRGPSEQNTVSVLRLKPSCVARGSGFPPSQQVQMTSSELSFIMICYLKNIVYHYSTLWRLARRNGSVLTVHHLRRRPQSRMPFSIGNVYWRQMNPWHRSHHSHIQAHSNTPLIYNRTHTHTPLALLRLLLYLTGRPDGSLKSGTLCSIQTRPV